MKNWGKREGIKEAGLEEQQPARIKGIKEARWRLYGCARIKGIAWIDIGNRPAIINSPRVAWLPLMCSELLPQSILAECSPIDRRRLAAPPLPMPSLARRPSGWLPARFTISRRGDPTSQIDLQMKIKEYAWCFFSYRILLYALVFFASGLGLFNLLHNPCFQPQNFSFITIIFTIFQ